jgi:hypothetical protein
MVGQVGGLFGFFFLPAGPDAKAFLFVDVGLADRHGDGKDGNVHHDEVRDLDGGVQVRDVDDGEASCAGRGGLEEAREEAVAAREGGDGWVVELLYMLATLTT